MTDLNPPSGALADDVVRDDVERTYTKAAQLHVRDRDVFYRFVGAIGGEDWLTGPTRQAHAARHHARALIASLDAVRQDELGAHPESGAVPDILRERLRVVLGHDELPDDDGLIADVEEWIRVARALGQPVPEGHQEKVFTRADIARVADEWDRTADRIESHGQDDPDRERIRSGIYRACAQTMRHLVHVPSTVTVQAPAETASAVAAVVDAWRALAPGVRQQYRAGIGMALDALAERWPS